MIFYHEVPLSGSNNSASLFASDSDHEHHLANTFQSGESNLATNMENNEDFLCEIRQNLNAKFLVYQR